MTLHSRRWRGWWRLALFAALNAVLIPPYLLALGPARRLRRAIQVLYTRICMALLGFKLVVQGRPAAGGSVLFAVNHVSYLDIPVLARLIDGSFVAKREVSKWPLFGFLAHLTGTVFVERSAGKVLSQRNAMVDRLERGGNLILFAEGTSTDGSQVAPFKSSLFSIAGAGRAIVQPVSIAYVRYADGTPLTGPLSQFYAWYGDATMFPHLVRALGLSGAEVAVTFHAPIPAGSWRDRKDLARRAQAAVSEGVRAAHAGAHVQVMPAPVSRTLP